MAVSHHCMLELGKHKQVLVGASHTSWISTLLPASLEAQFFKLPAQQQTTDSVGDICDALS